MKKRNVKNQKPKKSAARLSPAVVSPPGKRSLPVASSSGTKTRAPRIQNRGNVTTVSHSEYLFELNSTTSFSLPTSQVVVVQPGLIASFPWLAQIAASYEMYKVKSMTFHYRNRISTGSSGNVYMAFQNDSDDAIFSSKQELMAYEGSQSDAIWLNQDFKISIADYMKKYFIRTAPLDASDDAQLYDVGLFSICAVAGTAAIMGDVSVSYTVEFYKPKVSQALGSGYYLSFNCGGGTATTFAQHPFTTGFGLDATEAPYGGYWTFAASGTTDRLSFKAPGIYMLMWDFGNTSGVVPAPVGFQYDLGPNANILDTRTNGNPAAAQGNLETGFALFQISGGAPDDMYVDLSFSGVTGTFAWIGTGYIIKVAPGDSALEPAPHPGVRRGRARARPEEPPKKEEGKLEHKERSLTPRAIAQPAPYDRRR